MDNQPIIDRGILIPILISAFSIIGIIVVLIVGRSLNSPAAVVAVSPSATPFEYLYLGTEPGITTPLTDETVIAPPTDELTDSTPIFRTPTPASVSTPLILTQPNVTNTSIGPALLTNTPNLLTTSTATLSGTAAANMVDDTDSRLSYQGSWLPQTGVSGAYQGTLRVSSAAGSTVTFSFTGPEIHVFYQAGPSFGSITITIDGVGEPPLSQSESQTANREWSINDLTPGSHTIVITHASGGSVNIDSLLVPTPAGTPTRTPTPTLTPTSTSTQ
jgi:hypothetical protein